MAIFPIQEQFHIKYRYQVLYTTACNRYDLCLSILQTLVSIVQWFVGSALLVKPVTDAGALRSSVTFPGTDQVGDQNGQNSQHLFIGVQMVCTKWTVFIVSPRKVKSFGSPVFYF